MSWNLPPGCTQADIDRAYGDDMPDDSEDADDAYERALDEAIQIAPPTDDRDPSTDPFAGDTKEGTA